MACSPWIIPTFIVHRGELNVEQHMEEVHDWGTVRGGKVWKPLGVGMKDIAKHCSAAETRTQLFR